MSAVESILQKKQFINLLVIMCFAESQLFKQGL